MSRQKSNSAEAINGFDDVFVARQAPKSGRDKQTLFVGSPRDGQQPWPCGIEVGQFRKTKLCRFHETGRAREGSEVGAREVSICREVPVCTQPRRARGATLSPEIHVSQGIA